METLGLPYTCFNSSNYGTLLIVDPEEEFFDEEIKKLQNDVFDYGLSVIIFADWYNTSVMSKMKFFDENTREWWTPDTGGSNIPALNDLLEVFDISLTDDVMEGYFRIGEHNIYYGSGSTLGKFPQTPNNIIISANLYDQGHEIITSLQPPKNNRIKKFVPVIGLFQMQYHTEMLKTKPENFSAESDMNANTKGERKSNLNKGHSGRLVIIGDSNCIDSTFIQKHCLWLLKVFLEYTMNHYKSPLFKQLNSISHYQNNIRKIYPQRVKSSRAEDNLDLNEIILEADSIDEDNHIQELLECMIYILAK
ncbi:hypothetical protein DOY81_008671 [Sarcophaga bullata]|nr:hypothetical protein DOY81_008671 [Sarcophaga bullata]